MQTNCITSDAFTKREAASEELYIRQEEKAKYDAPRYSPPILRWMGR